MSSSPAKFISQGAIIQEFRIGSSGRNIVLGFNTAPEYRTNPAHFGENIGRTANRLEDAKINNLNGRTYQLTPNDGPNSLHGGVKGWGVRDWTGPTTETRGDKEAVVYKYISPDEEEGFPGEVEVSVAYTYYEEPSGEEGVNKTVLEMEYEAKLVRDDVEETVINITNHSYFNLSGADTIDGTYAILTTTDHLPLNATGIPISTAIEPYPNISANIPITLGATEPNFDDCFILNTDPSSIPLDTRPLPLQTCARFYHPTTKVHLEVLSTEPAFQFYTGKHIAIDARPDGSPARGPRAGFCVEPSRYVNAPNVPDWRNMALVKKGEVYGSKIVFKTWEGGKEEF